MVENCNLKKRIKQRDLTYDWIRFIITVCVIIGHSCFTILETPLGGIEYELPQLGSKIFRSIPYIVLEKLSSFMYSFHMPLFFILSGAVMALKPIPKLKTFLNRKAKRLLLPYLVYGFVFMLPVKFMTGYYSGEDIGLVGISFLFGGEAGHLWFLLALFWCMFVFVIIKFSIEHFTDSNFVTFLLVCIVHKCSSFLPTNIFLIKDSLGFLFYFAAGYYFQLLREKRKKQDLKKITVTFIVFAVIWGCLILINKNISTIGRLIAAYTVYLCSDILSVIFHKLNTSCMWNALIDNLFYVYIFHDPLEYVILKIFMNSNLLLNDWGCWFYIGLRTVGVFFISLFMGVVVHYIKRKIAEK